MLQVRETSLQGENIMPKIKKGDILATRYNSNCSIEKHSKKFKAI